MISFAYIPINKQYKFFIWSKSNLKIQQLIQNYHATLRIKAFCHQKKSQ